MLKGFQKTALWIFAGAVLIYLGYGGVQRSQTEKHLAKARFQEAAGRIQSTIQERLRNYDALLHSTQELIDTRALGQGLWRRAANTLHLEKTYPTLYGLGYAAYIPDGRRTSQMKMTPSGKRPDYVLIQQIEPRDRNAQVIGYDLGSELAARTAAEHARETRSPALSGPLVLPDDPDHRAVLLFYPIFDQAELQGWIFGRFRQEDLLKGLDVPSMILQVYDGPDMTREGLFFDSGNPLNVWQKPNETPLTVVKGFQALGRTWTLNFSSRPEDVKVAETDQDGGVPLLLVTGFLALVAFAWAWVSRRAAVAARQSVKEMQLRETALTLGPHGIVIADATQPDMPVVFVNRAFEKITGYASQDILGKNCRLLSGTDRDQKGLQDLRRALREQRDARVLLRNYRKDGTPFWNDLFVSPVRNDMGRVVEYVAIQQDVTEREQTTRRLATESAIIRALAESPSLYEASPRILKAICEAQEWDLGTFWRLDPRANILQCVDQWHSPDLELQDFENFIRDTTFSRDMGVPGHIWAKGEQIWLPDLAKGNRFPESALAVQAGLTSACGFPIANRRGLQGVLVFYSRRIWPLSKNLLLLMVGTGAQISQYMEREQVEIEQKELTILERGLAEFMGEGLIAVDREGFCLYVNVMAGKMLGYNPRTLLGQNAHEFLHAGPGASLCEPRECPILMSLHSTRAVHTDDSKAAFRRQNRDILPVAFTTSPIVHQDIIQGVVITFVDASARRAEEQKLRRALAEKEDEIQSIQKMLADAKGTKPGPHPSEELLEKIKKLLG